MKKLSFIIAALVIFTSCSTTRPAINSGKLVEGKDTSEIQHWPSGRPYVVKDGKIKNLYRKP